MLNELIVLRSVKQAPRDETSRDAAQQTISSSEISLTLHHPLCVGLESFSGYSAILAKSAIFTKNECRFPRFSNISNSTISKIFTCKLNV